MLSKAHGEGALTELGEKFYADYVSTASRSIVILSSFCLSLKEKNPRLQFYQSSTHTGLTVATPTSAPGELLRKFVEDGIFRIETVESFKTWAERMMAEHPEIKQ